MHTLESAADLLGISSQTVRRWMKRCQVEGTKMEIDRKLYLSDSDLVTLASYQQRKTAAHKRKRADKINNNSKQQHYQSNVEGDFYYINDAALFLGVSVKTAKHWIIEDNINRKIINTDRKRAYIARDDIFRLAELHNRNIKPDLSPINITTEINKLKEHIKAHAADIEDIKHDLRILGKRAIFIM